MRVTPADLSQLAQTGLPAQFASVAVLDVVQALVSRLQATDAVVVSLQVAFSLPTAEGVQLDALGALVGQARLGGAYPAGESDDDYRQKIRAAILRNRSGGTVPDLIAVVSALLSDLSPQVIVTQAGIAAFSLTVIVDTALTAAQLTALAQFVQEAKAAGVGATVYPSGPPTFAYTTFPDPPFAGYNAGHWAPVLRL